MINQKVIFFRNDDVGLFSNYPISLELINLTNIFIEENVPISHGVVPAVINKQTVNWLKEMKSRYPHLIGIDQHGYQHLNHGCGEFGGCRDYKRQKEDISAGLELMKEYFGEDFSYCFTIPWTKYTRDTKKICAELGFRVFSGAVSPKLHARVFNKVGQFLNLNVMLGKPVSYHKRRDFNQRGFTILELSVGIDVLQNYKLKQIKPYDTIKIRYRKCKRYYDVIGFCLHYWAFDSCEKLDIIRRLLRELKSDTQVSFKLIEEIGDLENGQTH